MRDVIVIGMSYLISLGTIRSLGEAGYRVKLLTSNKKTKKIAGRSKYVTESVLVDFEPDQIIKGLEQLRGNEGKPLVLTLNDRCCKILDEHYETLSSHFCLPNVNEETGALVACMDKYKQKQAARECGLLTAEGFKCSTDENGVAQAVKDAKYPCFLKPAVSASMKNCKTALVLCNDEDELRKAMREVREKGCSIVLIEEYLNFTKELCVYGLAANGNAYAPVLTETIRDGFSKHKGVTIEGYAKSANELADVKEKIIEMVKKLNYMGLFCVDLLQCGDKTYFSEINLRGGGSGYAATLVGANVTAAMADIAYDHATTRNVEDVTREVRFLNERLEFDAYQEGFISRREYEEHLANKEEGFLERADDPEPWRKFQKTIRWAMVKLKLKSFCPKSLFRLYQSICWK